MNAWIVWVIDDIIIYIFLSTSFIIKVWSCLFITIKNIMS